MGTDDIFKKRREDRKQRKHDYRNPKANSFLIVTEGERTEPLYFKGMQKLIEEKIGGNIEVVENPVIDVQGKGCSTGKLIEITDRIVKDARIIYQNVWIVFDYEDIYHMVDIYDGVSTAIKNAKRRMADYRKGIDKASEYDPGTTVYKLVEDLKRYLEET